MRRRERSRGPPHSRGCSLDGYDKVRAQPAVRQATPSPCPPRSCFEPRPDALSSQSQSFSRSYGSNLPTSLTYIVLSTRGCSPWRPAADIGTARHEIHVTPWGFQGAVEARRTPQEPRCFTETRAPISGQADSRGGVPYKEKRTLPGVHADVSNFAYVTVHGPEGPISVSRFGNINPIPFRSK